MSAEPTREQWRAAEPAVLRAYAQAETERSSMRVVAERIGMGRTTLYSFLAGTNPHPRVRRLLALWYLRETGGEQVDADACAALLSALPPAEHEQAVLELQAFVRELRKRYGAG